MSSVFSNDVNAVVSGTVDIGTMPEVEIKNDAGNPIPVTGPLTDAELRATPVPVSGALTITPATTATAVVTSVPVSTTVATLKAANAARLNLIVFNETGILFVKLGTGASSSDYTYRLTANTTLEIDEYTGIVTGTKSAGTSNAQVTEL